MAELSKPNDPPTPLTNEQKLARARQDHRVWTRVALHPSLNAAEAQFARNLARSAAAEVKLRQSVPKSAR